MQELKKLTGGSVIGEFIDTITYLDGTQKTIEGQNLIVNDIGKLIACLFKNNGFTGLTHWAIGSGQVAWDGSDVKPVVTDTQLETEFFRKVITEENMTFLNDQGHVTDTPTNRIEITVTFSTDEANGQWREFAIFGGNATDEANSGIMINHKIHRILTKDDTMTIERKIRFTFN